MRAALLIVLGGLTLSAAGTAPEQIVFSRVLPQPDQIGLFIAPADGRDEHPLVLPGGMDYDASWSPDGWSATSAAKAWSAASTTVTAVRTGRQAGVPSSHWAAITLSGPHDDLFSDEETS
jgi:hypothetical protein